MFRFKIVSALIVVLGAILWPIRMGSAQSSIGPGVDLIILIDQSGSMSIGIRNPNDREPTLPPTDPDPAGPEEPLRIYTARYLIDYMSFDNLYVNPNRTNRVLVIGFGSANKTRVMVPLTLLKSSEDVENAKKLVKSENLGDTSFLSAFELIRQQFPASSDSELANDLRRRLVVVITDGGPYDPGEPQSFAEYFAKLGDFYRSNLGIGRYPTYVIGIDKNDVYWSRVQGLWEKRVTGEGRASRVNMVEEINREVVLQLCPFLNVSGTGSECRLQDIGDHFVPPYARSVSFSFFKYDLNAQVTLFRPTASGETGGLRVNPTEDADLLEYEATPRDQFYVIGAPPPGCWRSERIGTGKVDVFTQIVFNDMLMTKPTSAHPVIAPLEFEFSLKDTNGDAIDELANFPLSVDAELNGPDGKSQNMSVHKVQAGLYASQQGALLSAPGIYTLTLTGKTGLSPIKNCLPSDKTYTVFSQAFRVPVYAPKMVVSTPADPYYHYSPLKGLAVEFRDDSNNPLPVSTNSPFSAELTLVSPAGTFQALSAKPAGGGYRSDEVATVPESGTYTVTAVLRDSGGKKVYEGHATFNVVDDIDVIRPGLNYPAFAPLRFVEIEIRDGSNQPAVLDPNYPLRIEAKMIWPDGRSEVVELSPAGSPGRYRAPADWPLTDVAPHTLEIVGYTSLLPGLPEQPVFLSRRTIDVSGNLPYYRVRAPDEQQREPEYPLHRWFLPPLPFDFTLEPQPVRVELWYGNQLAQAKDFFIGDTNNLFQVTVVDSTSNVVVDQMPLSEQVSDGSVFSGDLTVLRSPGTYTATVALIGKVRGGVSAQGTWPDATIVFQRRDSVAYQIIWAILTVAALGAAIYSTGGWTLNAILLPKAKGKLIAETVGMTPQPLWELPITRVQRHHFKVKERNIDARLGLARIEIRRAEPQERRGKDGRKEVQEGVEVVAYNEKGIKVASGSVYKTGPNKLPIRQKTSDNRSYQFRYED